MNKKAVSPLVATILLIVFALALGTVVMNWGKVYIEAGVPEEEVGLEDPNEIIQKCYISGCISEDEYTIVRDEMQEVS